MYGGCAGREVNTPHNTTQQNSHYIPCFHIGTLYRFAYEHITPVKGEKLCYKEIMRVATVARGPTICVHEVFTSFFSFFELFFVKSVAVISRCLLIYLFLNDYIFMVCGQISVNVSVQSLYFM